MNDEFDEELFDDLVALGKTLEIKSMIDMEKLDVVQCPIDRKVNDGRWVP